MGRFDMPGVTRWLRPLLAWLLAMSAGIVLALPLQLTDLPAQSLGTQIQLLQESDAPLSLAQARTLLDEGRFRAGQQAVLSFGIGARPVWLYLDLINPTDQVLGMQLLAGATWTDRLDVYVVQAGRIGAHWRTGDESADAHGLAPALGYALALDFPPGQSELFLRVESIDPMVMPVELMTQARFIERQRFLGYFYGFFYGFLAALCAYNLLLFGGLGERSYLYYALYLLSLIALNAAYTGHGLAWVWPGQPLLQRDVILVLMVLFGACGLLFASRFLALKEHAPRALRTVQWLTGVGVGAMLLSLLAGSHLMAALVAFSFMATVTSCLVGVGVLTVRHGRAAGRYFLVAVLCGALGIASTLLAVWGWIPYTPLTYHAGELGIIVEATLLALSLSYRIRLHEQLARLDPLTGLNNRRAFMELTGASWGIAERGNRPLSLILLDIDRFKQINDQHGHEKGDLALVEMARMILKQCRSGDILARWGGEEFILMLPETDLEHACVLAERIRQSIAAIQLPAEADKVTLTASFGVAQRVPNSNMAELIKAADTQLYEAKRLGRNRVSAGGN